MSMMTDKQAIRESGPASAQATELTEVELVWIEKQIEHWIRFGHETSERLIDRRRRCVSFAPESVFALIRWAANRFGTVSSHLYVVRTVRPGCGFQTVPSVTPGGDILLHVASWPKVERVLSHIDAIEALRIDLSAVAPDHWRHVHNRLATGEPPRPYTLARHRAWLKRLEVSQ